MLESVNAQFVVDELLHVAPGNWESVYEIVLDEKSITREDAIDAARLVAVHGVASLRCGAIPPLDMSTHPEPSS